MWELVERFFSHLVAATNPMWWYYPLCAIIALVYKATKYDDPIKILRSSLHFFLTVSAGMFALGLLLYLIQVVF
jgi:hypothetical protein